MYNVVVCVLVSVRLLLICECVLLVLAGILHFMGFCFLEIIFLVIVMLTLMYRLFSLGYAELGKK